MGFSGNWGTSGWWGFLGGLVVGGGGGVSGGWGFGESGGGFRGVTVGGFGRTHPRMTCAAKSSKETTCYAGVLIHYLIFFLLPFILFYCFLLFCLVVRFLLFIVSIQKREVH